MKFECGDLERALVNPDLMAEAREHLRECSVCRNEYRIWNEISTTAKQLQCEWESPGLWARIRQSLEAARAESQIPNVWRMQWRLGVLAAAAIIIAVLAIGRWPQLIRFGTPRNPVASSVASDRDFLTEQALKKVEENEAAYRHSIEELSRLAEPKLESTSSAVTVSYREKLLLLDSAISETRSNLAQNRFNTHLQTALADLYRDKQHTLQEILTSGKRN